MNISKSSWHYRLLNALDFIKWRNQSLCGYFWKVVGTITIGPFMASSLLWIATMPLWWIFTDAPLFPLVFVIGGLEIFALSYVLAMLVVDRHDEEIIAGTRERPVYQPPREPSLFAAWLKAKHRKVCPLIDFVAEE